MNNYKMYFGRIPEDCDGPVFMIDEVFPQHLARNGYNFEQAVDSMVGGFEDGKVYYTLNPLIPNFLDDEVAKLVCWIIDENGNHINVGTDESMLEKIQFMGPGDLLCDDARSFL